MFYTIAHFLFWPLKRSSCAWIKQGPCSLWSTRAVSTTGSTTGSTAAVPGSTVTTLGINRLHWSYPMFHWSQNFVIFFLELKLHFMRVWVVHVTTINCKENPKLMTLRINSLPLCKIVNLINVVLQTCQLPISNLKRHREQENGRPQHHNQLVWY